MLLCILLLYSLKIITYLSAFYFNTLSNLAKVFVLVQYLGDTSAYGGHLTPFSPSPSKERGRRRKRG